MILHYIYTSMLIHCHLIVVYSLNVYLKFMTRWKQKIYIFVTVFSSIKKLGEYMLFSCTKWLHLKN